MGFQIVDNKVINISENSAGNDNIIYHTAPIVFEACFFPCKITYHSAVQDPKTESCAKINQNPPSAVSCIFVLWIAIIFCIYFIVFWDFKKLIIVVMDREFLHAAGARVKAPIVLSETCREAPLLDIKKL